LQGRKLALSSVKNKFIKPKKMGGAQNVNS